MPVSYVVKIPANYLRIFSVTGIFQHEQETLCNRIRNTTQCNGAMVFNSNSLSIHIVGTTRFVTTNDFCVYVSVARTCELGKEG